MTTELAKTFDPAAIEARWYAHWEKSGGFRPHRPAAQPFTIVNPPPNVTGSLHIGHALDNTLQDVVIRYERLRGKDALWVVGTDHAGIATQMVVERQMAQRQDKRTNYTREEFVAKVWEWKAESGGTITGQLRRLGCSMDWSREQFTMDPHFTRAVTKVFVDLYNQGLLYRDKRLVNWDPALKTAISDLEVENREVQGGFWHFRYPLADGVTTADGADHLVVATTRPETMLADMAVAVHPDDPRYASVIGKDILQPITGRRFRVVADEHADPALGSGVVKITPGHDFNDFEVGKRAGIAPGEMLNMFDGEARVVQTADGRVPGEFLGLDRFEARERVVAAMKALGHLIPHIARDGTEHDAEPRTIQQPYGDRGGVPIEPWLTDQWYVDAKTLAQPPMQAVRDGRIEIVPKSWEKTFFNWMENIQPWCVSRQLWWGHQIPAWYGPKKDETGLVVRATQDAEVFRNSGQTRAVLDKQPFIAETEEDALLLAREYYGEGFEVSIGDGRFDQNNVTLSRDQDVLDTWFSSALWPFATLGWPDDNPAPLQGRGLGEGESLLSRHYPNDLLISGFDILFFWDARMAMQGMHFLGEVPWKRLYLHGLVRAADGAKMSKSKGNVVDPLGLIDTYGADALRFFMCAMESQGRDVKMDEARVEGYRNFATKLWNATRFCQANGIGASQTLRAPAATSAVNRWIVGEVVDTLAQLDKAMADLRFDAAAQAIYRFAWDTFCDWYLELIKGQIDSETRDVAGWVLDQILVMLHPFMPFMTEELWHSQGARPYDLIVAQWPQPEAERAPDAKAEVEWLIDLTRSLRTARAEVGVPPSARTSLILDSEVFGENFRDEGRAVNDTIELITRHRAALHRLARVDFFKPQYSNTSLDLETGNFVTGIFKSTRPSARLQVVVNDRTYFIPLEGLIDIAAEKARLARALAVAEKEAGALAGRLGNANFVERAKPEAVEKARADHAAHAAEAERLKAALERLG